MKRRRIVLIKPPEISPFSFGAFSLAVLAASIRHLGDIEIIDATRQEPGQAAAQISILKPDLVGVTVMSNSSVPAAETFIKMVRSNSPSSPIPILAGGHGAACFPEIFLKAGAAAVVTGEGESALQQILENGVEPGMPGTACLSIDNRIIKTTATPVEPLDRLPFPARDLIPPPKDGIHLLETSRGCPYQCKFCETTHFYGNKWRPHTPKRVAEEVAQLVETFDAWTIMIADDNFAADAVRVIEICERIATGPRPAVFFASMRADDLVRRPEMAPAMAKAGILRVTLGVETLEPEAAAAAGKPISPETYREAFALLRRNKIFSFASFITGLPGQQADVHATVELAVKAGPDAALFVPFIPMPGTPMATGNPTFEPKAADIETAKALNALFYSHPVVRRNLGEAANSGGIRALLAKAVLN